MKLLVDSENLFHVSGPYQADWCSFNDLTLVFETDIVQVSVWASAILPDIFRDFFKFWDTFRVDLPNTFQFTNHSTDVNSANTLTYGIIA